MATHPNKIKLGISTCPNDTFAFAALIERRVDWRGLDFEVWLGDIQELNYRLSRDELDVGKASFHAALWLAEKYVVLRSGSAIGYGVGPLLLAAGSGLAPTPHAKDERLLALLPGPWTTAHLLYQMFYPKSTRIEHVVFSEIMPRLVKGVADFGVCIHEGRFTYQQHGLTLVEDLGDRWELESGLPLPLGGILASTALTTDTRHRVNEVVADSLHYAWDHPGDVLPLMRRHAQEFDDEVLMKHVELYVNERTLNIGAAGRQALDVLGMRARECGWLPERHCMLEVQD